MLTAQPLTRHAAVAAFAPPASLGRLFLMRRDMTTARMVPCPARCGLNPVAGTPVAQALARPVAAGARAMIQEPACQLALCAIGGAAAFVALSRHPPEGRLAAAVVGAMAPAALAALSYVLARQAMAGLRVLANPAVAETVVVTIGASSLGMGTALVGAEPGNDDALCDRMAIRAVGGAVLLPVAWAALLRAPMPLPVRSVVQALPAVVQVMCVAGLLSGPVTNLLVARGPNKRQVLR